MENGGDHAGNGGDSIAIKVKVIGARLVAELRYASKKMPLQIDVDKLKTILESSKIETTKKDLILNGKRKDAINYPNENRIIFNATSWRLLSIQDKRMLVLHELLGLLGVDDKQYEITMALEKVASVEVVPYFAGKDEDCLDEDHQEKKGEIIDVEIVNIIIVSDIYSSTDRESYCTISGRTSRQVIHKFSASYSYICKEIFSNKKNHFKLRIVSDHVCKIL